MILLLLLLKSAYIVFVISLIYIQIWAITIFLYPLTLL